MLYKDREKRVDSRNWATLHTQWWVKVWSQIYEMNREFVIDMMIQEAMKSDPNPDRASKIESALIFSGDINARLEDAIIRLIRNWPNSTTN